MKIGFVSLGCPKNLVDSEVMIGLVQQDGHDVTPDAAEADVLVVNTCAFIDSAKQESVDAILELAALKRTGRCKTLVVTGCLAERCPGRAARADSGNRHRPRHGRDSVHRRCGEGLQRPGRVPVRLVRKGPWRPRRRCPTISTTPTRHGRSSPPATTRTSRSRKAATTRARSASFPPSGGTTAADRRRRSWPRPGASPNGA